MIVADTNVFSEPLRAAPNRRVLSWLLAHEPRLAITTVTVAELRYGAQRLADSQRGRALSLEIELMVSAAGSRVLSFDEPAAAAYAELRAKRERLGRTVSVEDTMIAAICVARGYALATRNTKDFEDAGIGLLNPWD